MGAGQLEHLLIRDSWRFRADPGYLVPGGTQPLNGARGKFSSARKRTQALVAGKTRSSESTSFA